MKWLRFPSRGDSVRRKIPRPQRSALYLESLEERCLLDAGLGGIASGLRDASLVLDINTQINALQDPNVPHQQPLGYLYSDLGGLIGSVVSSIPGADTKTIGQAITTASDLGRLAALFFNNGLGLKNLDSSNDGQAVQDFVLARQELKQAGPTNTPAALAHHNAAVTKANEFDTKGASKINETPSPTEQPITTALNDMYLLNNDAASVPGDPTAYLSSTDAPFQKDEQTVVSTLPLSAAKIATAVSDLLAVAGDVTALAGGPVGGIVGDALEAAHDALSTGIDLTGNDDPTSDLLSLGADGINLINDILTAPNPNSQPLSVTVTPPTGGVSQFQAGANFAGTIATFSDPNVAANQAAPPASDYTADISWGDGSSSFGQIAAGSGGNATYTITGTHLYATPGDYPVSVVVAGNGAQGQGSADATVNANTGGTTTPVQDITVAGQNLATQGSLSVSSSVATVYAPPAGTYTATIDWGDGTTSTGQLVANGNGTFAVTGSHTYSQAGSYMTNVLVSDSNGNVASAFGSTATAAPTSSINPLPAIETSTSFTISWSGSDPGGPGIATYDIYYSDNGGPFTAGLTDTTQTSSVFTGIAGHSYAFYSVATDGLGITQPTPTAGQATTTVQLPSGGSSSSPSPPASPPPANSSANNPLQAASGIEQQIFAYFEQIVSQIEAEVQQLLNAELALEQEIVATLRARIG